MKAHFKLSKNILDNIIRCKYANFTFHITYQQ